MVLGVWVSQQGNLSPIASSVPTTTGITMILTFHSCSSLIFNDRSLSIFSSFLFWIFSFLGRTGLFLSAQCQADCEADSCWSRRGSPRESWHDHSWLLFWIYSPVFTELKVVLSTYCPEHYCGYIVVFLSVLGFCELAAATVIYMPQSLHVACTTGIWKFAQCDRSYVPLPWCLKPALELP